MNKFDPNLGSKQQVTDDRYFFGTVEHIKDENEQQDDVPAFFILDSATAILQVYDSIC